MEKKNTIDAFFKRKYVHYSNQPHSTTNTEQPDCNDRPPKSPRVDKEIFDSSSLELDPGLRRPIWEYPIGQRDEIRRFFIKVGPYQPILPAYPSSGNGKHIGHFQASWFTKYFSWLEYSPEKDVAFCLPCYVFSSRPNNKFEGNAFTTNGFRNWKKVNDGKNCAFFSHIGACPNSPHNICVKYCDTLKIQSQHIEKVFTKQSSQSILNNRVWLKTSIDAIKWLTFQACGLRGNDDNFDSINQENFVELIKFLASCDEKIATVDAQGIVKYISPDVQKQILHILAKNVRARICEIGDAKYCILVDEVQDEFGKEQIAIVLRFVDRDGFIQERFFDIIHVSDTKASTLKNEISFSLSSNDLSIHNIRGQGYDGASNMRGEWNGLQSLILNDCPYAYYIHCLVHRLQLALVAASKEICHVHQFFFKLTFIINVVCSSPKQKDQLRAAQANNIIDQIANNEGSHFNLIRSIFDMFEATCSVLENASKDGNYSQRGDASAALDIMSSFEFVFILHMMRSILGVSHDLCQALQCKSQDILNSLSLVSTTKILLQDMRQNGWDNLFKDVASFCEKHGIIIPNMSSTFTSQRGRHHHQNKFSVEEHYGINIFFVTVDTQWQELNHRFGENVMELLTLSSYLEPGQAYKHLDVDRFCELASKFYSVDFTEQEMKHLEIQARHYEADIPYNSEFKQVSTISELCYKLMETRKSLVYPLIDRLIRLILTLPVSTATTERPFSTMNILMSRLRNKMDDEFFANSLIIYIERNIAENIDTI